MEDDPPTVPDRRQFPCPACRDELGVPTGDVLANMPEGYGTQRMTRRTCDTCFGKKKIDHESLLRWKARQE